MKCIDWIVYVPVPFMSGTKVQKMGDKRLSYCRAGNPLGCKKTLQRNFHEHDVYGYTPFLLHGLQRWLPLLSLFTSCGTSLIFTSWIVDRHSTVCTHVINNYVVGASFHRLAPCTMWRFAPHENFLLTCAATVDWSLAILRCNGVGWVWQQTYSFVVSPTPRQSSHNIVQADCG